ncbi:TadE/TadG family type IV pilus assembly protein [Hyphococcus sp. DH-69]|uniref:TadE/TadG family type IV pilus assembly protein n=1 Tax=Hyphococcus formosus TaxID=3143534 RepID=UPI00398BADD9
MNIIRSLNRRMMKSRSGSAAVEFAIVAPVFLMMILGMLGGGIYLGAVHSVRQLTSDVARATIAGADEGERIFIAKHYVKTNAHSYAFLRQDKLYISVEDSDIVANQFDVEIIFYADELPIWNIAGFFPFPNREIKGRTSIRNGGFSA